jgi:hypothetical protein
VLAPGLLLAAAGLLWFTRIGVNSSYALHVLVGGHWGPRSAVVLAVGGVAAFLLIRAG